MKRICEALAEAKRVFVSDGAWGTELQKRGLQPGECPELWCAERPDAVRSIAAAYLEAGAELVKTNSFGATRFKLEHFGLADRASELNERSAALSRAAAGSRAWVIASVGPTGKLLLLGEVTEEEIYAAFREQAVALERGGADACLIETFTALDEAALAIRAAKENTRLEVICTFTFERTVQGEYRTMMGVSPSQAVPTLRAAGADIVGSNCGNGMAAMAEIVRQFRVADPHVPVAVHANAGLPVRRDGRDVFPESPEEMVANARAVAAAGANILGGCCGTTPEHIRALAGAFGR